MMAAEATGIKLAGVIAAPPTPVDRNGEPDIARFLRHARWALAHGCDGLNVLGTTGEANSLSVRQRLTIMEAAAGSLDRRRLLVGTGAPDLPTTIELTRAAERMGFAGALVLPPYYYKDVTDEGLYSWFAAVIEASGDIPVYLYNFPRMTGIYLSAPLIRRLRETFAGRIAGAKDSSGDLAYAAEIAAIEGFAVFPSDESTLALASQKGFAGCISATANLTAPLAARLWRNQGDAVLAGRVSAARKAIAAHPLIPAVKHLVARLHGDKEYARLLPPHVPLTDAAARALAALVL
jgi:4-hydroxy-tetrahydrodipicolinate synthase